jgi:ankyrin repeat protein
MGRTPLASAAECGHKALVEILIQREEVVADSKDVSRALSAALKRRNQGIVQLLTALVSGN